jgi:hypothetical protein
MNLRLLNDELPTRQERQCEQFGVDHLADNSDSPEDIAWGSDPFDIVAHREAHGLGNDDD